MVQTDGNLVKKPTVYFPADGAQPELRLFRVEPGHLEVIEGPPSTEVKPPVSTEANQTAPDGNGNLSQSELDNLFE